LQIGALIVIIALTGEWHNAGTSVTQLEVKMGELTVITVEHRCVDGWHVFTSADVFGLYVASKDPMKAIEDVIPSVQLLLRKNEGIDFEVVPTQRFRDFLMAARMAADRDEANIPHPSVIESKSYVLRKVAA